MTGTCKYLNVDRKMTERLISESKEAAERAVNGLRRAGVGLATAESCTGGLIGGLITGVSGASEVYRGGIICYTNEVKMGILGVPESVISEYTEVSFETAEEMAVRVRELLCADIGISVTGYAGPTGGTEKDPVGTVYVGLSASGVTEIWRLSFDVGATRDEVRVASAGFAIERATGLIGET